MGKYDHSRDETDGSGECAISTTYPLIGEPNRKDHQCWGDEQYADCGESDGRETESLFSRYAIFPGAEKGEHHAQPIHEQDGDFDLDTVSIRCALCMHFTALQARLIGNR